MSISLRHIEIFHAIMVAGNLTKAAELLRTSQPTISRELARLEQRLGFRLFERRSRQLLATQRALMLHAEVQRSYFGLEHLVQVAEAIRDESNQPLVIGCLPLFSTTLIPRVARRMLEIEPLFRLALYPLDHSILMRDLLALRLELGVAEVGVSVEGMETVEIAVGEEVCVLPMGHPLAERKIIGPGDLDDEMLISVPKTDSYRARFQRLFSDSNSIRNLRIEASTADAICALVRQGLGVALINPFTADAQMKHGVVVRPLSISIPFVVGICHPRGRPFGPSASKVAALITKECHLMADKFASPNFWRE